MLGTWTQFRRQYGAEVVVGFADGVDMYHAVLNQREVGFDSGMNCFGNVMGCQQGQIIFNADFHIHIDAAAEHTGVKAVHMLYAGNLFN